MRNAAGKPFSAVKALPIALDVVNGDNLVKLARDEKERERTRKRTNAVPTHSMHAVARTLKGVGIDLTDLTTYAVNLHDYQYNGFEPGFSKYSRKEDVLADLLRVVKEALDAVNKYFPEYALKELAERVEKLLQEFNLA